MNTHYTVEKWIDIQKDFKNLYLDAYTKQGIETSRIISIINTSGLFVLISNIKILSHSPILSSIIFTCLVVSLILSLYSGIECQSATMNSILYLDIFISRKEDPSNYNPKQLQVFFKNSKRLSNISILLIGISLIFLTFLFYNSVSMNNPNPDKQNKKTEITIPQDERLVIDEQLVQVEKHGIVSAPSMQLPPKESPKPQTSEGSANEAKPSNGK